MVVQLIMSTGPLVGPLVALICVAQFWGLWRLMRIVTDGTGLPHGRTLAAGAAALVPFAVLGIDHELSGSTVMFLAATVGYIGGSALLFLSLVGCGESANVHRGWGCWP